MQLDGDEGRDRTARRLRKIRWKRIALWASVALVVVFAVSAGAAYAWFRSEVGGANGRVEPGVVAALKEKPPSTTTSDAGRPSGRVYPATDTSPDGSSSTTPVSVPQAPTGMNILVLGSDRRATESEDGGRSDTLMVVHVDPQRDFLSIMSIPRDLRAEIPGHGVQKINSSYTYGGPALAIRTVQQLTGIDLDHYVEVDFSAFKDITNTLGGVYVDVDRTYDDGLIQFAPGYQLLDGLAALRYVRTRHDLNLDFGRMQRQQRFINALREQAMTWNLALKLPGLVKGLFKNLGTDLGANDILKLGYWGVGLGGNRMKQVRIIGGTETIDGVLLRGRLGQDHRRRGERLHERPPGRIAGSRESGPGRVRHPHYRRLGRRIRGRAERHRTLR